MKSTEHGKYNSNWFMKKGVTGTLQVTCTPLGELANKIKQKLKTIERDENKTLVIEKSGIPISAGLKKENPYKLPGCPSGILKCPVKSDQDCSKMNISYEIKCSICSNDPNKEEKRYLYLGCSGRTIHTRSLEHMTAIQNGNSEKSAMAKHYMIHHPEETQSDNLISVRILAQHKYTLNRLIDESLRLEAGHNLANSKGEWGRGGGLTRLIAVSTQATSINLVDDQDRQIERRTEEGVREVEVEVNQIEIEVTNEEGGRVVDHDENQIEIELPSQDTMEVLNHQILIPNEEKSNNETSKKNLGINNDENHPESQDLSQCNTRRRSKVPRMMKRLEINPRLFPPEFRTPKLLSDFDQLLPFYFLLLKVVQLSI